MRAGVPRDAEGILPSLDVILLPFFSIVAEKSNVGRAGRCISLILRGSVFDVETPGMKYSDFQVEEKISVTVTSVGDRSNKGCVNRKLSGEKKLLGPGPCFVHLCRSIL